MQKNTFISALLERENIQTKRYSDIDWTLLFSANLFGRWYVGKWAVFCWGVFNPNVLFTHLKNLQDEWVDVHVHSMQYHHYAIKNVNISRGLFRVPVWDHFFYTGAFSVDHLTLKSLLSSREFSLNKHDKLAQKRGTKDNSKKNPTKKKTPKRWSVSF